MRSLSVVVLLGACCLLSASCERREIPPRGPLPTPEPSADPRTLLEGGERVFADDFDRAEIGEGWVVNHTDWRIEGGQLHSTAVDNAGVWLEHPLPEKVRVEFNAHSDPLPDGKPFPGDIKCEIFATEPVHQAGYVIINGGWTNRLDVLARLDEHGKDRLQQGAAVVEPERVYRWAVARAGDTVHWFRDGELLMSYRDASPVRGTWFGFNNWRTNVYFDDLEIYAL